jgi:hypothetical protein
MVLKQYTFVNLQTPHLDYHLAVSILLFINKPLKNFNLDLLLR